jgi:Right handed beta helix region
MGSRALLALALLAAGCQLVPAARIVMPSGGGDDTAALQAELDRGGRIVLPALPDGRCYRTRGLWISRSGTELTSNGACLEALGPGPVRLRSPDGDLVTSSAVLFVSRETGGRRPVLVRLDGLRLVVPREAGVFGIAVYGDGVVVHDVRVEGEPVDGLSIGGRSAAPARSVSVVASKFLGAQRNVISVVSAVDVRIAGCTISGAGAQNPSAGIDLEPDDELDPLVRVRIEDNTIERNAGAGILLALSTDSGLPRRATRFTIARNRIGANGAAGVYFQGGQKDGRGVVYVNRNAVNGNGGAGLQGHPTEGTIMRVLAKGNDLSGNTGGETSFVRLGRGSRIED